MLCILSPVYKYCVLWILDIHSVYHRYKASIYRKIDTCLHLCCNGLHAFLLCILHSRVKFHLAFIWGLVAGFGLVPLALLRTPPPSSWSILLLLFSSPASKLMSFPFRLSGSCSASVIYQILFAPSQLQALPCTLCSFELQALSCSSEPMQLGLFLPPFAPLLCPSLSPSMQR